MDKEVEEFCYKYDASVQPSTKMHRRAKRMNYKIWSESDPTIFQTYPSQDVKCVEVHMPEDRFRALLEHDEWLHRAQMSNYIGSNEAVYLIEQHQEEVKLRHEHPGVMDAWQQYQTMLQLVK
jgi:predicted solute-binding protein